jgi:hypothetical protein
MSTHNTEEQQAYKHENAKDHDEDRRNESNKISTEKRETVRDEESKNESDKESDENSEENSKEESDEESDLNSADETFQCPDCDEWYVAGQKICDCDYNRYVDEHGEEDSDEEEESVDEVWTCPTCENTYVGEPDCDCGMDAYLAEKAAEKEYFKRINKDYRKNLNNNRCVVMFRRDKNGNRIRSAKRNP